ncbi:MAG: hypothetical protein ACJ71P_02705 [Nitrososphaeraceae archaeon]
MISKEEKEEEKVKAYVGLFLYIQVFLNTGIQIRHFKNLTPMNFAVDDRYFYATIDK